MIRRPRSPTLFPYTTLFRSSTETCGPPKRRSESADPQDVRDRWHPVARDDEEHVMPRRCEIRARRHRHLQAGAGEPEGQRRKPLVLVERVCDRPEPDERDAGDLVRFLRSHAYRLAVARAHRAAGDLWT